MHTPTHFAISDTGLTSSTGPEINIDSILALEKRIEEGVGDVIRLTRTRNSLLNISTRVPPEVLGHISHWNVIPEGNFEGLRNGSYNFLFVCHHWFEVASRTPELWTFWGNTLKQWSQQYRRSGTVPLDLVLNACNYERYANAVSFDGPLRDALRDRATHDSIRSARLRDQGRSSSLLRSIISSLTPEGESIRCSSIELLRLEYPDLEISNFLTRNRFPKLRHLDIWNARLSSWDHLKLQATSLTTLSLGHPESASGPTTSQLLLIFASYPNLQDLSLHDGIIPREVCDGSTFRAPLHCLRKLRLDGDCRHIPPLLDRLDCPDVLDNVDLELRECAGKEALEFLKPYLQDRIRRDDRFRSKLLYPCLVHAHFHFIRGQHC